jgi:hypothetical protein
MSLGRKLAKWPSLMRMRLSKRLRRLLFIVDIGVEEVNVCGIFWNIMFYFIVIVFGAGYFSIGFLFSRETYFHIMALTAYIAGFCVGLPMSLYCFICYLLKRRKQPSLFESTAGIIPS